MSSPRYRCIKRTVARAGPEATSPRSGIVKVGEIVEALEELDLGERGGVRVRGTQGWVGKHAEDNSAVLEELPGDGNAPPIPALAVSSDGTHAANAALPAHDSRAPPIPAVAVSSDGKQEVAAALQAESLVIQRKWSAAAAKAVKSAHIVSTMRTEADIDPSMEQRGGGSSIIAGTERARRVGAIMDSIEIFRVFKPAKRRYLTEAMTTLEVGPGQDIVVEGEDGDAFYIIESGVVRVSKRDENGEPHKLVELRAGQYFGELALLEDAPRAATVTAVDHVTLLALSREDFCGIIGKMAAVMRLNQGYSTVRKTEASHLTVGRSLKDRMSSLQTSEDALQRHRSTDAWEDIKQRGRPALLPPKQADNTELVETSDVEVSMNIDVAATLPRAHTLSPDAAGGMTLQERVRRAQESFTTGIGNRSGRRSPDEELSQLQGRGHVRDRRLSKEAVLSRQRALQKKSVSPEVSKSTTPGTKSEDDRNPETGAVEDLAKLDDHITQSAPVSPRSLSRLSPKRPSWDQELQGKALVSGDQPQVSLDESAASAVDTPKLPPARRSFEAEHYSPISERVKSLGLVDREGDALRAPSRDGSQLPRTPGSLEALGLTPVSTRVNTLTSQGERSESNSSGTHPKSATSSLVGKSMICLARSVLRASADPTSAKLGTMKQGTVGVVIGEELVDGVHRVQFVEGWLNAVSSSGQRVLSEPLDRSEAEAVASAVTKLAPPPIPSTSAPTSASSTPTTGKRVVALSIPQRPDHGAVVEGGEVDGGAVDDAILSPVSALRRGRAASGSFTAASGLSVAERKLQAQQDFEQRQHVQTRTDNGTFRQLEGRGHVRNATDGIAALALAPEEGLPPANASLPTSRSHRTVAASEMGVGVPASAGTAAEIVAAAAVVETQAAAESATQSASQAPSTPWVTLAPEVDVLQPSEQLLVALVRYHRHVASRKSTRPNAAAQRRRPPPPPVARLAADAKHPRPAIYVCPFLPAQDAANERRRLSERLRPESHIL